MLNQALVVKTKEEELGRPPHRIELGFHRKKSFAHSNMKASGQNNFCGQGVVWPHAVWSRVQPEDPKDKKLVPWDPKGSPGAGWDGHRFVRGMRTDSRIWHYNHCPDGVLHLSTFNKVGTRLTEGFGSIEDAAEAVAFHKALANQIVKGAKSANRGKASPLFHGPSFRDLEAQPLSKQPKASKEKKTAVEKKPRLPKVQPDAAMLKTLRANTDAARASLAAAEACAALAALARAGQAVSDSTAAASAGPGPSSGVVVPNAIGSFLPEAVSDSTAAASVGPGPSTCVCVPNAIGSIVPGRKHMQELTWQRESLAAFEGYMKEFKTLAQFRDGTVCENNKMAKRIRNRLAPKCLDAYQCLGEEALAGQSELYEARDTVLPAMAQLLKAAKPGVSLHRVRAAFVSAKRIPKSLLTAVPIDWLEQFFEADIRSLSQASSYRMLFIRFEFEVSDIENPEFDLMLGGHTVQAGHLRKPRWVSKQLPFVQEALLHVFTNARLDMCTFRAAIDSFGNLAGHMFDARANEHVPLVQGFCFQTLSELELADLKQGPFAGITETAIGVRLWQLNGKYAGQNIIQKRDVDLFNELETEFELSSHDAASVGSTTVAPLIVDSVPAHVELSASASFVGIGPLLDGVLPAGLSSISPMTSPMGSSSDDTTCSDDSESASKNDETLLEVSNKDVGVVGVEALDPVSVVQSGSAQASVLSPAQSCPVGTGAGSVGHADDSRRRMSPMTTSALAAVTQRPKGGSRRQRNKRTTESIAAPMHGVASSGAALRASIKSGICKRPAAAPLAISGLHLGKRVSMGAVKGCVSVGLV